MTELLQFAILEMTIRFGFDDLQSINTLIRQFQDHYTPITSSSLTLWSFLIGSFLRIVRCPSCLLVFTCSDEFFQAILKLIVIKICLAITICLRCIKYFVLISTVHLYPAVFCFGHDYVAT